MEGWLRLHLATALGREGQVEASRLTRGNPVARNVVLSIAPGSIGVEECNGGVGVGLDQPQGVPHLPHKEALVRDNLGAGGQALEDEVIGLVQPDVHGAHGQVGEGTYPELLPLRGVDVQHADLLAPSEDPGCPHVQVRTLVQEVGREDGPVLHIHPHTIDQGPGRGPPEHSAGLTHTAGHQLQLLWAVVKCI